MNRSAFANWAPWAMFLVCIGLLASFGDGYLLTLAMVATLWAILAYGLNFVMGYAGYYHLGLGALYGLGAYGAATLSIKLHQPMIVGLVVMPIVAGACSALIGPLVLRTKGLHFAVATLALGMIVSDVLNNWVSVTGGPIGIAGIPRPGEFSIGPLLIEPAMPAGMFLIAAAVLLVVMLFACLMHGSSFVLILRGIKSDDVLSQSFGYKTTRYKVAAFALAGAIGAEAGVLYAHIIQYISPEPFTFFSASFHSFVVLAVGGPGTFWGPVIGAVLLTLLPEVLQLTPHMRLVAYGAILLFIMVVMPKGLAAGLRQVRWPRLPRRAAK